MEKIPCIIHTGLYEHNMKKYINIKLDNDWYKKINKLHIEKCDTYAKVYTDSLNHREQFLKVKVPYRYRKFEIKTHGNKIIHDYKPEDEALVELKFCGFWKVGDYYGNSWKLVSISPDIHDTKVCHPLC